MDFFAYQEQARRRTSLLVFYFVLAVGLIIFALYSVINYALFFIEQTNAEEPISFQFWNVELFAGISIVVLAIILISALIKTFILARGGGAAVATMLDGRLIDYERATPEEKRLLNVVEEMAIASGVPVPPVYVLEESGINAFAAGYSPFSAVIGITRGAIQQLSRDELQGVIAHEFSHIFNGDMRLNIKLIGIIFGILVIHIIGKTIARLAIRMSSQSRFSTSRRNKGGSSLGFIIFFTLLGIAIMLIGWIGVLFCRIIQSAISRQREFLADASAVQFTRNPYGLLGVLVKISKEADGSLITHPKAEEASHMFFANGVGSWLNFIFATHPPITTRIKRLDPNFQFEKYTSSSYRAKASLEAIPSQEAITSGFAGAATAEKIAVSQENLTNYIGNIIEKHVAEAANILQYIPLDIRNELYTKVGAQSFILALVIFASDAAQQKKDELVQRIKMITLQQKTKRMLPALSRLPRKAWLAAAEVALGTLNGLTKEEKNAFKETLKLMIEADDTISLFEYALIHIVEYSLLDQKNKKDLPVRFYKLRDVEDALSVLLSTLAYYGRTENSALIQKAFDAARIKLEEKASIMLLPPTDCGLHKIDEAMQKLIYASYPIKKQIIAACSACIAADGTTTIEEAELFRAISAALHCPVPLILPS